MNIKKKENKNKIKEIFYDYYLALEWSQINCVLAMMKSNSTEPKSIEFNSEQANNLKMLKSALKNIKGRKIITIEETTTTHWLYVELKEYVDKIFVCDPYRNSLLSEGPKNDPIDAGKLCQLLRNGMLKEVYHSLEEDYKIRKLESSYSDVVKAGVRVLNQRSALYRAVGLRAGNGKLPNDAIYILVESNQNKAIELYYEQKEQYEKAFNELRRTKPVIKNLYSVSGIGDIGAVKIYSRVIDAKRFEDKYAYWAYCGLVKHEKQSGKRSYGKKKPRYNRTLKGVYKSAAWAAIGGKNDIREYYEYLLKDKHLSEDKAVNQIARYIAKVTLAIMKNNESYKAYMWRKTETEVNNELQRTSA